MTSSTLSYTFVCGIFTQHWDRRQGFDCNNGNVFDIYQSNTGQLYIDSEENHDLVVLDDDHNFQKFINYHQNPTGKCPCINHDTSQFTNIQQLLGCPNCSEPYMPPSEWRYITGNQTRYNQLIEKRRRAIEEQSRVSELLKRLNQEIKSAHQLCFNSKRKN